MSSAIFPLSTDLRKLTQIWRRKGLSVTRYGMVDSLFCSVSANTFREISAIRGLSFVLKKSG